jgi:hypothetical protein
VTDHYYVAGSLPVKVFWSAGGIFEPFSIVNPARSHYYRCRLRGFCDFAELIAD